MFSKDCFIWGKFTEIGNTCLIAEFRTLDCLVGLHWIQSFLFVCLFDYISFCANSYKKHAWMNLRRRSGLVNEEGTNFNYINHLHIWPHVVMFEVVGSRN